MEHARLRDMRNAPTGVPESCDYPHRSAQTRPSADTSPDASDWGNELLYCGYRRDVETGLYHVRHRYYHPTMGRWVSPEPLTETIGAPQVAIRSASGRMIGLSTMGSEDAHTRRYRDGMQLFAYVGSAPSAYRDPSGLERYIVGCPHSSLIVPEWDDSCSRVVTWWKYDMRLMTCGVGGTAFNALCSIVVGAGEVIREATEKPKTWRGEPQPSTCAGDKKLLEKLEKQRNGKEFVPYHLLFYNCNWWCLDMADEYYDYTE